MTTEIKAYEMQCNNCKQSLLGEYDTPAFYRNEDELNAAAYEAGWQKMDGNNYCDECPMVEDLEENL